MRVLGSTAGVDLGGLPKVRGRRLLLLAIIIGDLKGAL
jgi:hypothetical protein